MVMIGNGTEPGQLAGGHIDRTGADSTRQASTRIIRPISRNRVVTTTFPAFSEAKGLYERAGGIK